MPGADSSRGRLLFRPETTWNETPPANAATTRLRFTGESLHHANRTVISEEIRPDRQRSDLILVGFDVDGDMNFELSYGNFDWLLEAVICSTGWSTNQIVNGTTNRSFNFEKGFLDIGKYISYRGCVINSLDMSIVARRQVQMTVGILGAKGYPATTSIAGTATPTEPTAAEVMAAGPSIKLYDSGGANVDLNDLGVREIRLSINNAGRIRELATQQSTDNFGFGAMEITATLNAYFADIVHYSEFISNEKFALQWTMSDPTTAANSYRFTLPLLKATDANPTLPSVDADSMLPITLRAMADTVTGYAIKIERAVTPP